MCGTASLCRSLLAVRSIILGRPTTFPGSSILIPHSMKRNIRRTARCSSRPHSPSLMDCRSLPLQLRLPMRSCTSANKSGLSLDELCTSSRTSTPAWWHVTHRSPSGGTRLFSVSTTFFFDPLRLTPLFKWPCLFSVLFQSRSGRPSSPCKLYFYLLTSAF